MAKNEYQFYDMMWYPAPYQKEFFGYFGQKKELSGGEPMDLSRAKPSEYLILAQQETHRRWWIWKWIPFVEQVCLTGKVTFNTWDEQTRIWLWIITNPGRLRSTYALLRVVFSLINILQKRKGRLQFGIWAMMPEDHLSCIDLKQQEYDALLVYQLAHLSVWYQKHDTTPWNIYTQNEWLIEYLPNFPSQYVIWLGLTRYSGANSFGSGMQQFLWYRRWNLIEWIYMKCITWIHVTMSRVRTSSLHLHTDLIWRDEWKKSKVNMKRKLLRKKK